jgi:preprotein translocase subunit SecF
MGSMAIIVIILAIIIIFLVCRELICWYWKINRGIELLENINVNLEFLVDYFIPDEEDESSDDKNQESEEKG